MNDSIASISSLSITETKEERKARKFKEKAKKNLADWGFQDDRCYNCNKKHSENQGMLVQCNNCKKAYYCSAKCFNKHLPVHRTWCNTGALEREPSQKGGFVEIDVIKDILNGSSSRGLFLDESFYLDDDDDEEEDLNASKRKQEKFVPKIIPKTPTKTPKTPKTPKKEKTKHRKQKSKGGSIRDFTLDLEPEDEPVHKKEHTSKEQISHEKQEDNHAPLDKEEDETKSRRDVGKVGIPDFSSNEENAKSQRTVGEVDIPDYSSEENNAKSQRAVGKVDIPDYSGEENAKAQRDVGKLDMPDFSSEENVKSQRAVGKLKSPFLPGKPRHVDDSSLRKGETIKREYGWEKPAWARAREQRLNGAENKSSGKQNDGDLEGKPNRTRSSSLGNMKDKSAEDEPSEDENNVKSSSNEGEEDTEKNSRRSRKNPTRSHSMGRKVAPKSPGKLGDKKNAWEKPDHRETSRPILRQTNKLKSKDENDTAENNPEASEAQAEGKKARSILKSSSNARRAPVTDNCDDVDTDLERAKSMASTKERSSSRSRGRKSDKSSKSKRSKSLSSKRNEEEGNVVEEDEERKSSSKKSSSKKSSSSSKHRGRTKEDEGEKSSSSRSKSLSAPTLRHSEPNQQKDEQSSSRFVPEWARRQLRTTERGQVIRNT